MSSSATFRRKKNVKKGIQFCLMVCGASGTGRTTFVNMLCGKDVLAHKDVDDESAQVDQGLKIKPVTVELDLDEDRTRISLTIVDTPGFGDEIDNEASFGEIAGYLERQYDDQLAEESRIKRNPRFRDNRVHVMLYFITPTGHGLRELDIELMRRLAPRVNVIPVIGRADSLTPSELAQSKKLIMEDIEYYRIPVYNFPYDVEEDDEETVEENAELRSLMPFAIVGSEEVVEIGGRKVRARQYPWGVVEVDDPKHSDFLAIRSALLYSHLVDLKEITFDFLYENYRTEKLSKAVEGGAEADSSINPDDMVSQSYRLKEEQLRREEEKFREIEIRVQREINEKAPGAVGSRVANCATSSAHRAGELALLCSAAGRRRCWPRPNNAAANGENNGK
ncbi:cell division control protein [Verticillium alfalfae VaMs.102]|uniref:Cell division control protein n=4 Tax=Verticillium TaxID=1036719 RepID=C9SIG0_VERA1|nr:cell division control protein [Verticillium alfalfae VaMs.102]EEY18733.1 cell division control protein [Verticillium alfalfae VaMs.102]